MLCPAGFSSAQGNVGIGVSGGTLGIGAEVNTGLTDSLSARIGGSYLSFSFDSTISYVDYEMEPEFVNGSLLLDWSPFDGALKLTGGIFLGDDTVSLNGTPRTSLIPAEFASLSPLADSVSIHGNVEFNSVAPYVGLGWNSNQDRTPGWGASIDLGVLFMGEPTVSDLTATGPMTHHPAVTEFLEEEKIRIEDDLEDFQYYPVATLMLSYYF